MNTTPTPQADAEAIIRDLLWNDHPECCGCPVVGAEYMGMQEFVCCGNPDPALLNDKQIVATLRAKFPEAPAESERSATAPRLCTDNDASCALGCGTGPCISQSSRGGAGERVPAAPAAIRQILEGYDSATWGWQGDDPCGEPKARAAHAEECIRRIREAMAASTRAPKEPR